MQRAVPERACSASNRSAAAVPNDIDAGADPDRVLDQDYFEVYLRYWEQYHCNLALTGLGASRNWQTVVYGRARMMELAGTWFARFRCPRQAEEFKVFGKRDRHPAWREKAEAGIRRVAATWRSVGLVFPLDEVMAGE